MFIPCLVDPLFQVLAELPAPVLNGTTLTVEDFHQELKCSINIKHRFFFLLSVDYAPYNFMVPFLGKCWWLAPVYLCTLKNTRAAWYYVTCCPCFELTLCFYDRYVMRYAIPYTSTETRAALFYVAYPYFESTLLLC